jgi:hypothetical protein
MSSGQIAAEVQAAQSALERAKEMGLLVEHRKAENVLEAEWSVDGEDEGG